MAKTLLVVRAELSDPAERARFDHWYATDHLPWALRAFGARRGWRCWSRNEPAVHFWRRVVGLYTGGAYQEAIHDGEVRQRFQSGARRRSG